MKLDIADKFLVAYIPTSSIILFILGMKLADPTLVVGEYHVHHPWQIPTVILLFVIVFLAELVVFLYLKKKK